MSLATAEAGSTPRLRSEQNTDTDFHGHGAENQKASNPLELLDNLVAGAGSHLKLLFWATAQQI
jgi:hypothetical protein